MVSGSLIMMEMHMLNDALFSSKKSDWETPDELFTKLDKEFSFVIDLAATKENSKCPYFLENIFSLSEQDEKLLRSSSAAFMNPPYGRDIGRYIKQAMRISDWFLIDLVMLLPARVGTQWWGIFWDYEKHKPKDNFQVRFLEGRLTFKGSNNSAPFPSAIVIYKPEGF
jgi:phage N-6-adenine-methyltransferase